MKVPRILTTLVLAVVTFVLTVAIARSTDIRPAILSAANDNPPGLFSPVQSSGRGGLSVPDPTVVRQRSVTADTSLITRTRGSTITLNLFDDVSYRVVIEQVEEKSATAASTTRSFNPGSLAITLPQNTQPTLVQFGRVRNTPDSEVYLVQW